MVRVMKADTSDERTPKPRPLAALLILLCSCGPCGPIPGGALSGEVQAEAPSDWQPLIHEEGYCQIEVNPPDPYSFTANCFVHEGTLHVASMGAPDKRWPAYVAKDPNVRVRFGDDIFLRRTVKIEDAKARAAVFRTKRPEETDSPEDTMWFYHLEPRP